MEERLCRPLLDTRLHPGRVASTFFTVPFPRTHLKGVLDDGCTLTNISVDSIQPVRLERDLVGTVP